MGSSSDATCDSAFAASASGGLPGGVEAIDVRLDLVELAALERRFLVQPLPLFAMAFDPAPEIGGLLGEHGRLLLALARRSAHGDRERPYGWRRARPSVAARRRSSSASRDSRSVSSLLRDRSPARRRVVTAHGQRCRRLRAGPPSRVTSRSPGTRSAIARAAARSWTRKVRPSSNVGRSVSSG